MDRETVLAATDDYGQKQFREVLLAMEDKFETRRKVRTANIEIDLSQTSFVDSCGLGTLIALHKTACSRRGMVRLLNPTPPVQQILELTRMHRIFEIVKP